MSAIGKLLRQVDENKRLQAFAVAEPDIFAWILEQRTPFSQSVFDAIALGKPLSKAVLDYLAERVRKPPA